MRGESAVADARATVGDGPFHRRGGARWVSRRGVRRAAQTMRRRARLCVVATPYELDLDHDACARACGKAFREARMEISIERLTSRATPTFRVGHSLGCKLATLLACEEDERDDGTIEMDATSGTAISTTKVREDSVMCVGNFMIGFNNADAAESAKLIEKFARELLKKRADRWRGERRFL